mmetsp:Transcript_34507/g.103166  ORF Transcript_34507/g.103166 Transcript_34507/m.103166 type:complete len:240 (+) Transcript_34507:545-1264(+)
MTAMRTSTTEIITHPRQRTRPSTCANKMEVGMISVVHATTARSTRWNWGTSSRARWDWRRIIVGRAARNAGGGGALRRMKTRVRTRPTGAATFRSTARLVLMSVPSCSLGTRAMMRPTTLNVKSHTRTRMVFSITAAQPVTLTLVVLPLVSTMMKIALSSPRCTTTVSPTTPLGPSRTCASTVRMMVLAMIFTVIPIIVSMGAISWAEEMMICLSVRPSSKQRRSGHTPRLSRRTRLCQ